MVRDRKSPAVCLFALGLAACGGGNKSEKPVPTPEFVRDNYALGGGSCWRYRFTSMGVPRFATASVEGPNEQSIAGHTVYVYSFRLESGGLPEEWFFDTEADGEIRLLRSTEGQQMDRQTYRYEGAEQPPLFAKYEFDLAGQNGELAPGERFEVDTIPEVCDASSGDCMMGETERHTWTVLGEEMVNTPDGEAQALSLEYRLRGRTARYAFVEGKGFASFTDFDGTIYQLCGQRVCDSAGTCTGAADCGNALIEACQ